MRAEWKDVRWSWATQDGDVRVARQAVDGWMTLAELVSHVGEVAPWASLEEVMVSFGMVKWVRPATSEELVERESARVVAEARRVGWEGGVVRRYVARYGSDVSTWPCLVESGECGG